MFRIPNEAGRPFFRQQLLRTFKGHSFFLPAILSIEEFVETLTRKKISEELTLLFELFKIYKEQDKSLEFDRFYAWGKIILKDYDEIDRYMADAKMIYHGLQELKEIEQVFGFNDELRAIVAGFRSITDKQEKTKLLTEFLRIWEAVGKVYEKFQVVLRERSLYYGGLLYRSLAEKLAQPEFEHAFSFYHFCGFNALSTSEERIFDCLYTQKRAQLYWDADALYMNDRQEEAGDFLRVYQEKWPESRWFTVDSIQHSKNVSLAAVPQSVGQAHIGARLLMEGGELGWKPEETAIVLADEKLLLPVLYALPFKEQKVNVTMGYPMKFTVAYDLVECLLEAMRKASQKAGKVLVYVQDLKPLLSNAYISAMEPQVYEKITVWCQKEKKNKVSLDELREHLQQSALRRLFSGATHWKALFEDISAFLTKVFYLFKNANEQQIDREFIYFFLREFKKVQLYLSERSETLTISLVKRILREHFKAIKIPFEGEPLEGIQIMGFLETRTLDFKNVIILSANEGKLPAQRNMNSYIPYALRKAFQLPTFEEQDAIYAYHFKRLIQRAENIHFVYDSEVSKDNSGEKSRFILQQLLNYSNHPNIQVRSRQFAGAIPEEAADSLEIKVEKTTEVIMGLQRYLVVAEEGKFLSPTSLTTYVTCPLRFYFQYVQRLREVEEIEEDIDARNFGIVVHRVLELLYEPWLNREISSQEIKALEKLVERKVTEVLKEEKIIQEHQELAGKDLLTRQIMQRLVGKILQYDSSQAPLKIKGLERQDFSAEIPVASGVSVKLSGTVDRMDSVSGITRIIDYKTGKVKLASSTLQRKPMDEYMQAYFEDPDLKSGFQGYLYGLLARQELKEDFQIGVLGMRQLNEGIQWLRSGKVVDNELLDVFEEKLNTLVNEIFDPSIPFSQTEDAKRCQYCPYNRICARV